MSDYFFLKIPVIHYSYVLYEYVLETLLMANEENALVYQWKVKWKGDMGDVTHLEK